MSRTTPVLTKDMIGRIMAVDKGGIAEVLTRGRQDEIYRRKIGR